MEDSESKLTTGETMPLNTLEEKTYNDEGDDDENVPFITGESSPHKTRRMPLFVSQALHATTSLKPTLPTAALLKRVGLALLPSYIANWITSTPHSPGSGNGIAALDGLRGLGCFIVFNDHFTVNFYDPNTNIFIIRTGVLRLLWYGGSMVSIFFVLSGFVLSYKPLKTIRKRSSLGFHQSIASSALRRAIRLYLPSLTAIMIACTLASCGVFERGRAVHDERRNYLHQKELPARNLGSLWLQWGEGIRDCYRMLDKSIPWPARILKGYEYDGHLWTIPVEFHSSMALFIVLVMTSRLRVAWRMMTVLILIVFASSSMRTDAYLFFSGMVMAEIYLITQPRSGTGNNTADPESLPWPALSIPWIPQHVSTPAYKYLRILFWIAMFTVGLILLAPPSPHFKIFLKAMSMFPSYVENPAKIMRHTGAIFVVSAVVNCEVLQVLFTNRPIQYLGKISYALYVVHGNVIKSLGYAIMPWAFSVAAGKDQADIQWAELSNFDVVKAWFLTMAFVLPVTLWLSDVFWRLVDVPSVELARWVENKISYNDGWDETHGRPENST